MKVDERIEARRLRSEEGQSVRDVARLVGVSRGTASRWLRDLPLTEEQKQALDERRTRSSARLAGANTNRKRAYAKRLAAQEGGRELAKRVEPLHMQACMLYWAEGHKDRNVAKMTNSDSDLLRVLVAFLRTYFDVRDEEIHLRLNVYADHPHSVSEAESHWLNELALPRACLGRSTVNAVPSSSRQKRTGLCRFGVAAVYVCRTDIAQHIFGAIQEYGRCDRPEWIA